MTRTKSIYLALIAVLLSPMAANADLITFEGSFNTVYSAPITRSGYLIGNVAGDIQHFHEVTSTDFGLPNNGTGILLNDRDSRIFLENAGGATFLLGMFDVASALNNFPAVGITIEGFLGGFSTGTLTLNALGNGYTTLNGASLGSVDRLIFDGIGGSGGFALDNINVNVAVPEPGTLALLGIGLFGMGLARRRKKV